MTDRGARPLQTWSATVVMVVSVEACTCDDDAVLTTWTMLKLGVCVMARQDKGSHSPGASREMHLAGPPVLHLHR